MIIGINAAAAIKQLRTGVEEYTYQLIKHLTMLPEAKEHRFFLYVPAVVLAKADVLTSDASSQIYLNGQNKYFDFPLPENFAIKELKWELPMWTQIRLASEMILNKPDVLFIPVHILPIIHPKNSVVTIHGLEYEYFPQYYPLGHRRYLRWSTRYALKHARKIIAVSENTRQDLIKIYGGDANRIEVVHHGFSRFDVIPAKAGIRDSGFWLQAGMTIKKPYLLYLGRIEQKKNIDGILEAYKILKEKYQIPHKLILAGAPGFGYDILKLKIKNLKLEIEELGYVSEDEKQRLLANADTFLFPSFYEGFGLPVLEAQAAGVPVATSFSSSLPEIAGQGALFVNPKNPAQIAEAAKAIIDDKTLRDKLIQTGRENIKRFSWEKCARKTLGVLLKK